ncbi:HipA N-terminal domain-containing protein [Aggregatibacter actinomycetemcomitans]|nr:HipA N-terminal domain-containing protein [Aggregatibacter actinomycetemcomitans]
MNDLPIGKWRKLTKWLDSARSRPISLSLPLSHRVYRGDPVYNFFDNLLPDNEQIRSRIQQRFQTSTKSPFDLLSTIGQDCVGAIQL